MKRLLSPGRSISNYVIALIALASGTGYGLVGSEATSRELDLLACTSAAVVPDRGVPEDLPAADFTVSVNAVPLAWRIGGVNNPPLTMSRGVSYTIDLNAVISAHPFVINSNAANAGGTVYAGPASATTIFFTPDFVMPSTIYYHCMVHFTVMTGTITLITPPIQLSIKAFLEGAYNTGSLDMNDDLRSAGLAPLTEPYTDLGYEYASGGGEIVSPAVLSIVGNNAVVDWVLVELRDMSDPTVVLQSRAGLIQADGDVVAQSGATPMLFTLAGGAYYVALRHRSHLGIMTQNPVTLSSVATPIDFTLLSTSTFGTAARKTIGTVQALWMGDTNFDGVLSYTGFGNDRDPILLSVGSTTPNNTANGYLATDLNMNGTAGYTGGLNDRDPILVNVGSTTPNNTRAQQLP